MKLQKRKPLNAAQQTAVESEKYPIYLQAGAGSGKTHSLVAKVIHILETDPDADLSNMAIITYTNKATDELYIRLQTALYQQWLHNRESDSAKELLQQAYQCNTAQISTIHGFCERLLSEYGHVQNLPNTFEIRSFKQDIRELAIQQINHAAEEGILQDIPQYTLLDMVQTMMETASNREIVLAESDIETQIFDTKDNEFYNAFKPILLKICVKIEQALAERKREKNAVSVDDFCRYALKLLDDPYALSRISKQYRYVFIDELQDTSFNQFALLQKLIGAGVRAFVIGDKKQSIYGFRGADVQNAKRIEALVGHHGKIDLNVNYRTDPALLGKINAIFAQKFSYAKTPLDFPQQALESGRKTNQCKDPLRMVFGEGIPCTIANILEEVKIGSRPAEHGDIAILCRRNFELKQVAKRLRAKNIPVEVMGGKGFYATVEVVDTFKMLYALLHKLPSAMLETRNTFYCRSILQSGEANAFEDFLHEMDGVVKTSAMDRILAVLYEKSGIISYLRRKKQYQAVANLQKLSDKVHTVPLSGTAKPLQFVRFLEAMISSGKVEDEAEVPSEDRARGVITLCTIHKAKGLEFPIVVIPFADMPLVRKNTGPKIILAADRGIDLAFHSDWLSRGGQLDLEYKKASEQSVKLAIEEELRIFYVACTRAEHMLVLSCGGSERRVRESSIPSWGKWAL